MGQFVLNDHFFSATIQRRVYKANPEDIQQEVWSYLTFPLLDNFVDVFRKNPEKYPAPEAIAVLLTDQSAIFGDLQCSKSKSPYWQDTCELKPILQRYFKDRFPKIPYEFVKFIQLEPTTQEQSLDSWNSILELVQRKFYVLKIADQPIQINPGEMVYVSHQAGTPAISSAVQFCSLAKFGDRVKFVVSNEYNPALPEKPLEGSSYLRGIRIQEAKALLGEGSYNYAGVEALIGDYIQENEVIKTLLNAAKNWNVAKFSDFRDCLKHYPKFASEVAERTREENWWWIAYEEAYLAVIREKQDNIVEAFFHSFRAFEYIFAQWGFQKLADHFEEGEGDSVPFFKETILDDPRFLELAGDRKKAISGIQSKFKTIAEKSAREEKIKNEDKVEFSFFNLCSLFKAFNYADYKGSCSCLNVFFGKGNVRDKRNAAIHQVKGLSFADLCTYWGIFCSENLEDIAEREKSIREWKIKLKNLLNCVVKEDLTEGFATLEDASLMVKVHEELVNAIANL
ncbi:hypothetical protein ACN4EK_28445 [Pantanalinema rosaneae CENA516]|uniref:hypothetical protein n=1 Tax=Pantanalinema rosaneae TaxID=1620701 RepID=UPI003D6E5C49